jgi:pentatricopeptide repeat protein
MNSFFIEFRDPLFSIITFFLIIFIISFFSYWYSKYKSSEDSKYLDKFLKQFRTLPSKDELQVLISSGELSEKSWLLLAHSYSKNGDYEKSIEIYNELLKINSANRRETMFLLGKTYFKAGFLERSKQIFLSILKTNPRTPQALNYLLLVYEYMKDFQAAQDVLEPLDELKKDIRLDSIYLKTLALLNEHKIDANEKAKQLLREYKEHHQLAHMIYEYIFRVDPVLAWENFDSSKSEYLTDILWNLDLKDLNLDIISQNSYLKELYSAKSYLSIAKGSSVFEFDVLIKLQDRSNATLSFEYVCDNCKVVSPFVFNRCSSCHAIDTARVEWSLTKDYYKDFSEENNSFQ